MSDNGMSLQELRALAMSTGAPDSSPSPNVPVERLTNFMDVRVPGGGKKKKKKLNPDFSHHHYLHLCPP